MMPPDTTEYPPESKRRCEILLNIVDHLDAMVGYWDINQTCVFANNAYRAWFGKSGEEVVGLTMQQLLGPLYAKNLPYIRAAYAGHRQVFEREIPTPGGDIRSSLATYTPHLVDGRVSGIFVHVADVTPLKILERELKAAKGKAELLATHDFLTGLPNRVLLMDRITQALSSAERGSHMVAFLSLDIDDFKGINDTHGHGIGDRVLVEIAKRIRAVFRDSDTVTRLGGDEFLILAPGIESIAEVETIAHRILWSVREPFAVENATVVPAISLGIAIYPRDGMTAEVLIANSDRALYAAKNLGKNRYAFAEEAQLPAARGVSPTASSL
jgi:diguanylate cyclase (GGDEF)-like protein/PAS domain S-box-containing protein